MKKDEPGATAEAKDQQLAHLHIGKASKIH
jgi:hypothetical protein